MPNAHQNRIKRAEKEVARELRSYVRVGNILAGLAPDDKKRERVAKDYEQQKHQWEVAVAALHKALHGHE